MRYLSLTVIGLISLVSLADASESQDYTYVGTLAAGQTKTRDLELVAGDNKITVFSDDEDPVFTCKFTNDNGFVGLTQEKVPNCSGLLRLRAPMVLQLSVTNETEKVLNYQTSIYRKVNRKK